MNRTVSRRVFTVHENIISFKNIAIIPVSIRMVGALNFLQVNSSQLEGNINNFSYYKYTQIYEYIF